MMGPAKHLRPSYNTDVDTKHMSQNESRFTRACLMIMQLDAFWRLLHQVRKLRHIFVHGHLVLFGHMDPTQCGAYGWPSKSLPLADEAEIRAA